MLHKGVNYLEDCGGRFRLYDLPAALLPKFRLGSDEQFREGRDPCRFQPLVPPAVCANFFFQSTESC